MKAKIYGTPENKKTQKQPNKKSLLKNKNKVRKTKNTWALLFASFTVHIVIDWQTAHTRYEKASGYADRGVLIFLHCQQVERAIIWYRALNELVNIK